MRRETREELKIHLCGALIGAGIAASFFLIGMRAQAAEIRDGVRSPGYSELVTIEQAERADLRTAEPYEEPEPEQTYTQSDLDLMAAIIMAEAGDQDFTGMRLVGDVIMNRVRSGAWPDTISGVVYQPGQFSPVTDGGLDRAWSTVTPECYEAARMALSGEQIDTQVIYFSMWYCANGVFAFQHGDHFFGY